MDSCLSHIYVVWVIYVFWGRTEAHCHKPARRSLSCMCRPDRCKASEGEETNGVWRFSQTRWKSNARDLLLAIIWAFYDVLSHEIAELIHQVFMQVYVAYQQFVTTYLQYMGLFFVGYIFRIYGYIFRCILQQLEGIFGKISESSSLLHLKRRSTFFCDLFWCAYNANEKMLVCRCVCVYIFCVQMHIHVLCTQRIDMYTCDVCFIYTCAWYACVHLNRKCRRICGQYVFKHKDEKEGRFRNTDKLKGQVHGQTSLSFLKARLSGLPP